VTRERGETTVLIKKHPRMSVRTIASTNWTRQLPKRCTHRLRRPLSVGLKWKSSVTQFDIEQLKRNCERFPEDFIFQLTNTLRPDTLKEPLMAGTTADSNDTAANQSFEAKLWATSDALRGSMDAAEYKHVTLRLIFLRHISDAIKEQHSRLVAKKSKGAESKDRDGYRAQNIFWVLPEAHRSTLQNSDEGKNGREFYTRSCIVGCLVEMLAPCKDRICDPARGSGGTFVQSEKFVESQGGKLGDISLYSQESNTIARRLAVMNLARRGIEADLFPCPISTFGLHPSNFVKALHAST